MNLVAEEQLQASLQQALDYAVAKGASAAESSIGHSKGVSVSARMGEPEMIEYEDEQSFAVTVYFGQRKGNASSSDTRIESIKKSIDVACELATYIGEDEYCGLADPDLLQPEKQDLDLDHPWSVSVDEMMDKALECENAALALPSIVNSEGASLRTMRNTGAYGNTNGFIASETGTVHHMSCVAVAGADQEMQRDFWFTARRDANDLQAAQAVGECAAQRAERRLGARKIKSTTTPVIFSPQTARSLFGHFFQAISGSALYRGTSYLMDSLGKQVFPAWLDIEEQPHIAKGLHSAMFDNEGVATQQRSIVKQGILQNYVLDSYAARKLGMTTTGNAGGTRNPIVCGQDMPLDDLLAQMHQGLLVNELIGQGVNPVTGDYSQGAAGFWVEDGQIAYPVEEITLAGNLKDMFLAIKGIGQDLDEERNIRCGSVLIDGMMAAGT